MLALAVAGDSLFAASEDETIHVWNSRTKTCVAQLEGHEEGVKCLAVSRGGGGGVLISGSRDEILLRWEERGAGVLKAVVFGQACFGLATGREHEPAVPRQAHLSDRAMGASPQWYAA